LGNKRKACVNTQIEKHIKKYVTANKRAAFSDLMRYNNDA